jgi:hypothetical protein
MEDIISELDAKNKKLEKEVYDALAYDKTRPHVKGNGQVYLIRLGGCEIKGTDGKCYICFDNIDPALLGKNVDFELVQTKPVHPHHKQQVIIKDIIKDTSDRLSHTSDMLSDKIDRLSDKIDILMKNVNHIIDNVSGITDDTNAHTPATITAVINANPIAIRDDVITANINAHTTATIDAVINANTIKQIREDINKNELWHLYSILRNGIQYPLHKDEGYYHLGDKAIPCGKKNNTILTKMDLDFCKNGKISSLNKLAVHIWDTSTNVYTKLVKHNISPGRTCI